MATLVLLLGVGHAWADGDDWETAPEVAPTDTGETGLFSIITGHTIPKGGWTFGVYYNNWDRLASPSRLAPDAGDSFDYDHNRLSASVGYGITERFSLSLMVPYDTVRATEDRGKIGALSGTTFAEEIDGKGLANVRLGGHLRLLGDRGDDRTFALNFFAEAPTGDDTEGVSTGAVGFGAGAAYTIKRVTFNAGYHDPGDHDLQDVSAELSAGVGYAHPIGSKLHWISELAWIHYLQDVGPPDDADLTSGIRLWLGDEHRFAFNAALRTNVTMLDDTDQFCPIGGLIGFTMYPHVAKPAPPPPPPPPPPAAAKPEPPPVPPAPKPMETTEVCLYPSGKSRVDNICKAKLDAVALRLKQDAALVADIVGHSDASGSESTNLRMSRERADKVKEYLVARHGIDPARISTKGIGSAEPATGRDDSRRVVIVVRGR